MSRDLEVAPSCANLKQGDVIDLPELLRPGEAYGTFDTIATPQGVAIISQTCDVVQDTKDYCAVAPIVHGATEGDKKNAAKGRRPLHLFLDSDDGTGRIADLEKIISIPKTWLEGYPIIARISGGPSSKRARELSAKIMRAFGRFAFPDEVVPGFKKFRDRVQSKSGSAGNFGRVLDLITDLRVVADQWEKPGRNLTLYFLVEQQFLASAEDLDPSWRWNTEHVRGAKPADQDGALSLDRVCFLILENLQSRPEVLAELWRRFEEAVKVTLLNTHDDEEVYLFEAEVLSEVDMTYEIYKTTESFDLEALSHSQVGD